MNYRELHSEEFVNEVRSKLKPTKNLEVFRKRLIGIVNGLGFSDVDLSLTQSEIEFDFLISSLPKNIHETYVGEELYKNDLILDHLRHANEPIFDARAYSYFIDSPYNNGASLKVCETSRKLLKSHNYNESFTIPVSNQSAKMKFLFSVMQENASESSFVKQINEVRNHLIELANLTVEVITLPGFLSRLTKIEPSEKVLSKRELDVLEGLTKCSLTQAQLAEILGISPRTVEVHLSNIKRKLGTQTIAATIFAATNRGLLMST